MSSFGRAPLKAKSINVDSNLLNEWLESRQQLDKRTKLRWTTLLGLVLVSVVLLPTLAAFMRSVTFQEDELREQFAAVQAQQSLFSQRGKEAEPSIIFGEKRDSCQANNQALLAEVVTVFNSVPNKMALSKLHAEIMSGELTIVCSGDAEDAESGREFASKASAGERVKQALQQAQKKSTALSKDGVGFDFIKKVTVGR